jgi:mRNA interferase MazF
VGKFVKGDVVVLQFPFSDLSGSKRRPALIVADLAGDDAIVCQITSKKKFDTLAIPLTNNDFTSGSLPVDSFVRPNKIFTADENIVSSVLGHLSAIKITEIIDSIVSLVKGK